ncbi:hypothetical protein GGR50DRAFT_637563 [Xylaria sp. CBS 124048]|nr:hypothetical protein GGR50DRAFT_637563 [Xylaria sp. CBS 124048]
MVFWLPCFLSSFLFFGFFGPPHKLSYKSVVYPYQSAGRHSAPPWPQANPGRSENESERVVWSKYTRTNPTGS